MVELINQLRQAKEEAGFSYADIEAVSGVGISTVKRWFGSRRMPPRMQNFIDVAESMGYELKLVRVVDEAGSEQLRKEQE